MTYDILTEDQDGLDCWGTFYYPGTNPEKILSLLEYLKGSRAWSEYILFERESKRSYLLCQIYRSLKRKLREEGE